MTNLQRHTLSFVSSERLAAVAAVREERIAALEAASQLETGMPDHSLWSPAAAHPPCE